MKNNKFLEKFEIQRAEDDKKTISSIEVANILNLKHGEMCEYSHKIFAYWANEGADARFLLDNISTDFDSNITYYTLEGLIFFLSNFKENEEDFLVKNMPILLLEHFKKEKTL